LQIDFPEQFQSLLKLVKVGKSVPAKMHQILLCGSSDTLLDVFNQKDLRVNLFGTKFENLINFPYLNKFIDSTDSLSIQVHPDDKYAQRFENDAGKTEMWYIIDAEPDSKIVYGLADGITREYFENSVRNGKTEKCIKYVPISAGDIVKIPAGTIHALLKGAFVYEIQTNSTLTYRLFDWNRLYDGKPRQLHISKALDVINYNFQGNIEKSYSNILEYCIESNNYFNVNLINIRK